MTINTKKFFDEKETVMKTQDLIQVLWIEKYDYTETDKDGNTIIGA